MVDIKGVYGHVIAPSQPSPHLGKVGMLYEYNMLERSSPHYAGFGARSTIFHFATIIAMGDFQSGDKKYDLFSKRLKIALDVMYHRDQVGWFDTWTKKCGPNTALTENRGELWVKDLDRVMLKKYPDLPSYAPSHLNRSIM